MNSQLSSVPYVEPSVDQRGRVDTGGSDGPAEGEHSSTRSGNHQLLNPQAATSWRGMDGRTRSLGINAVISSLSSAMATQSNPMTSGQMRKRAEELLGATVAHHP